MAANNRTVQLCLVLDCTASMGAWIHAAKERLISSLNTIKQNFPNEEIHVGFVGYRDVRDVERFIVVPFTTNHQAVVDRIRTIRAYGGEDTPEDIGGAYGKVVSLGWTADVRVLFHVCDAPNHGKEYHTPYMDDDFPEGTGEPTLVDHVKTLAELKVDINFLRLNKTTDVMTTLMDTEYNRVRPAGFIVMDAVDQIEEDDDGPPALMGRMMSTLGDEPVSLGRMTSSVVFEDMLIRATSSAISSNPVPPSQDE